MRILRSKTKHCPPISKRTGNLEGVKLTFHNEYLCPLLKRSPLSRSLLTLPPLPPAASGQHLCRPPVSTLFPFLASLDHLLCRPLAESDGYVLTMYKLVGHMLVGCHRFRNFLTIFAESDNFLFPIHVI